MGAGSIHIPPFVFSKDSRKPNHDRIYLSYSEPCLRLSEICVHRPVFAFMLIMFLVVLGIFSFVDLGVDLFPRSDPASVNVRVRLPGATPEEVVSQVILPLEESIAAISGIDDMRAMVSEGSGNIFVTFVLERDIGEAAEDVREKVSSAMRK